MSGGLGGILRLLNLIEQHRAAVEYDWRTRFHIGIDELPERMGWDEAGRLAEMLCLDPSSALFAALAGWDYPMSREALLMADLFDVTVMANSDPKQGRPKPHDGRPFEVDSRNRQQIGNAGGRTREEVVDFLQRLGHQIPA